MKLFSRFNQSFLPIVFLISFLAVTPAYASISVVINGEVQNASSNQEVSIQVNHRYLDEEVTNYAAEILTDGTFSLALDIREPQLITLFFDEKPLLLYVEPGNDIQLKFDGNNFHSTIHFYGKDADNNKLLAQYLSANPRELNPFNIIRYKKNNYWYTVAPDMDKLMQTLAPSAFTDHMRLRKEEALDMLDMHHANHPGTLSDTFREYLTTEIYYDWAYHMLMYGHVYKNKYSVTDSYFEFMDEVPMQNENISNFWYREYLKAHVNYTFVKKNKNGETPYAGQYELATAQLTDRPLAYLRSEIISTAFAKKQIDEIMPKYSDYLKTTSFSDFDAKVVNAYEKAIKYAKGTAAPNFSLYRIDGKEVNLSAYKGKVVYLNFWASWCRPCIDKMNAMKFVQKEMTELGVVFINITLDKR